MESPKQINPNLSIENQNFLEDHQHCCLCGSELKFEHAIDYLNLTVKEDVRCPSCAIHLKSRNFILQ